MTSVEPFVDVGGVDVGGFDSSELPQICVKTSSKLSSVSATSSSWIYEQKIIVSSPFNMMNVKYNNCSSIVFRQSHSNVLMAERAPVLHL